MIEEREGASGKRRYSVEVDSTQKTLFVFFSRVSRAGKMENRGRLTAKNAKRKKEGERTAEYRTRNDEF